MNTQQAYINGFVKRAAQYGLNQYQAVELLKQAAELKGDQHKLDVDHDGKIESEDLAKLRAKKKNTKSASLEALLKQAVGPDSRTGQPSLDDRIMGAISNIKLPSLPSLPSLNPQRWPGRFSEQISNLKSGLGFSSPNPTPAPTFAPTAYKPTTPVR
jgi:hypothetical protein